MYICTQDFQGPVHLNGTRIRSQWAWVLQAVMLQQMILALHGF